MRRFLDRLYPLFARGGRFAKYHALYEMVDTLLYTPSDVTRGAPHVRDAIDLKRVMIIVVFAAVPPLLMGLWNVGFQSNTAMAALGVDAAPGWRGAVLTGLGIGYDPGSVFANVMHGLLYFPPLYAVTLAVGGFWEVVFAGVRNHEINEGFLVTSLLYVMILPASLPRWQAALGISFGVVIGKEVFGGTGKNFLNPALVGRAFLYFAYPIEISGNIVWTPVDGFSGATALGLSAGGGVDAVVGAGISWMDAFVGQLQGSLGETSTLACLLGAVILVVTGIASWRIIAGVFAGMIGTALLFNAFGADTNAMTAMPWYWHMVLGGFAFGAIYMATDPVSACNTNTGRWVYGVLIGFLTVLIRVANPAFPEGIMLAILLGNVFAPLIDWSVVRANIRRRRMRRA